MPPSSPRFLYRAPPRRTFCLTYPLRLRDRTSTSSATPPPEDDFYSLLLSNPTPNPARKTIKPLRAPKASSPTSSAAVPDPAATSTRPPENRILFSAPLAGPSARMRGLSRGEKGLGRPPEPDNCCMSGCVNCVWDAYREEVEEWAAGRRKREAEIHGTRGSMAKSRNDETGDAGDSGAVGDMDEPGGLGNYEGVDLDDESGLFEGVPVGIREFMKQEKRIRERKLKDGI